MTTILVPKRRGWWSNRRVRALVLGCALLFTVVAVMQVRVTLLRERDQSVEGEAKTVIRVLHNAIVFVKEGIQGKTQ